MKIKQGKMRILLACADESLLKQTKRLMQASNELELVAVRRTARRRGK
nr:hypothetical protein [Butyricicoccus sp. AF22-28AC]